MQALADRLQDVLGSRYVVERELGRGGASVVFLAHDVPHDREVAVKVFRADLGDAAGARRFQREIRLLARLQHPHILPLYDSGTTGDTSYFISPFIAGETVQDRLDRERRLPIEHAVGIATEVADALAFAHAHDVVHRDIKPANILLHDGHVIVADFGIARAMRQRVGEWTTASGISVGSPAYMSPEQANGDNDVDGRSDVYGLACVLFEMLAGEPPFTGHSAYRVIIARLTTRARRVRELRDTVPPGIDAAIARALERAPADRFASAAEFAGALRTAIAEWRPGRALADT